MFPLTVPSIIQSHSWHPVMGSYPYVFSSHWLQGFSSVPVTWGAQIQSPRKLENKVPGVPTSFNERTLKMSPKAKKIVYCVSQKVLNNFTTFRIEYEYWYCTLEKYLRIFKNVF